MNLGNNTPTLTQSELEKAPFNEKTKEVEVYVSVSLSSSQKVTVPENFDESERELLKGIVYDQITIPMYDGWIVDEFCVI